VRGDKTLSQPFERGRFYDEHDAYKKRRKKGHPFRRRYLSEIDELKNKYLSMLVPSDARFGTILEVGCGTGDLIGRFPINIPLNNRYGLDISPLNIEFARNEYPQVNFYVGAFEEFLKNEGKNIEIDVVILSDILEHEQNDVGSLRMAGDYAKYVLVNIPMEKCWETRKRNYGIDDVAGHLRTYCLKDAQKLIADAGLRIIDFTVEYYCKEATYKKLLKEELFENVPIRRLLMRSIPKYMILFLIDNIFFKWYRSSNFFGLLSK